jgi:hypothetical protein
MSAKAVRLSHELISRVVRARKVLFWDVVETSVALGHTSEAPEQLGKAVKEQRSVRAAPPGRRGQAPRRGCACFGYRRLGASKRARCRRLICAH